MADTQMVRKFNGFRKHAHIEVFPRAGPPNPAKQSKPIPTLTK